MAGKNKIVTAALLAVLVAAFTAGLWRLMALRFARGDIFPPYSSLRVDPLGTRAFSRALGRLPGMEVRQHFQGLESLRGSAGRTVFLLGLRPGFLEAGPPEEAEIIESLAEEGNRLVLAFLPTWRVAASSDGEGEEDREIPAEQPKGEQEQKRHPPARRWGVAAAYAGGEGNGAGPLAPASWPAGDFQPQGSLAVHTTLYFRGSEAGWRVAYANGGRPVIIERPIGRGSLVLLADAFPLSNEALRSDRHADLLAWLVGENRQAVFAEAHLGVTASPGVMGLVRQFRLHGFLLALLVMAVLAAWRGAVPLVPAAGAEEVGGDAGAGKDQVTGLINLLRRNLPPNRLLGVCFDEWHRTFGRDRGRDQERMERVRRLIADEEARPSRSRDPVAGYRRIAEILAERKLR